MSARFQRASRQILQMATAWIPAKAGMTEESAVYIRHARTFSAGIQGHQENAEKRVVWIPAFAGMTGKKAWE
jgi:hypothetical protein